MAVEKKIKPGKLKRQNVVPEKSGYIIIIAAILLAYSTAFKNGITNWDDGVYITDNPLIKSLSWDNIKAIFSTNVASNYHPLTILTYAIEYSFWEANPLIYHLVNVIIHLLNSILVYFLFFRLTINGTVSLVVSLLFAVHPMHTESVAWISERKDVLYTFFYLLSLNTFLKYTSSSGDKFKLYIFSILFFLFSLLSKGMAVSLPVVLLLLDFYNNRRFSKETVIEKIPFFVLSLIFGLVAVKAQQSTEAMELKAGYNMLERFLLGSYSFMLYIIKFFLPINLSAFYPYPFKHSETIPLSVYLSAILFLLFIAGIIYSFIKKKKNIFIGLSFFIVTIGLVLQFIPVGNAIMAERYSYISYIGLFFIAADYFNRWYTNKKQSHVALALAIVIILVFVVATRERCKVWKDSETLWSDVIKNHPDADIAYLNRGIYIVVRGKAEQAYEDFNKAIELNPDYTEAYNNRGLLKQNKNELEGSIEDFNIAIKADSNYFEAYSNRGISYVFLKRYNEAIADYTKTLELSPEYANVYSNRGNAYIDIGEIEKGITDLKKALELYTKQNDKTGIQRTANRLNQLQIAKQG